MATIFDRQRRLKPSQMRTVAERRFADAQALCDTDKNERANGAQYLGGFVIEMLLKARLIDLHPDVAKLQAHERMDEEVRHIWSLIYRSHDLDEMLKRLPQLEAALHKQGEIEGEQYLDHLREICSTWTIYARYSPLNTNIKDAREMLKRVRRLKEKLK